MDADRSLIVDVCVRVVVPTALVFALFLLFVGHNAPGGGFVAGLVAAAAIVLRYLSGEREPLPHTPPPAVLLGSGLALAVGVGGASLAVGSSFLTSAKWEVTLPGWGAVAISSSLFFDIGVFLVVVGLVLTLLHTLGEEATS